MPCRNSRIGEEADPPVRLLGTRVSSIVTHSGKFVLVSDVNMDRVQG